MLNLLLKNGFICDNFISPHFFFKEDKYYDETIGGYLPLFINIEKTKKNYFLLENQSKIEINEENIDMYDPTYLKSNDKKGFVYLIKSELGYKIGKTKNIRSRSYFFGVNMPFKWELIDIIPTFRYHDLENHFKKIYEGKKINGEWFNLKKKDLKLFFHIKNQKIE